MKKWILTLILPGLIITGWGKTGSADNAFDINLTTRPKSSQRQVDEELKKSYYRKYLREYRFRTARHRTFYKNGF